MSQTPILSVVIPVYNVTLYLDHCVESVLKQGFAEDDLQVILVNDGSTDGSELLAEKWAIRHPNIVEVVHQVNAGLSAARNTGTAWAKGKYLVFLDSDDVIPPGAYQKMISTLESSGSDFVTAPAYRFTAGNRVAWPFNRNIDLFTTTRTGLNFAENPEFIRDFTAWNKIYRREFFVNAGVKFPVGRIYEDVATSPMLYQKARAFDVLDEPSYFWRVTPGGITQTIKPVKAIDRLWAVEQVKAFFQRKDSTQKVLDEVGFALIDYNLRWVFLEYPRFDEKTRSLILEKSRHLLKDVNERTIRRVQSPISDWALLAKNNRMTELDAELSKGLKVEDLALLSGSKYDRFREKWKKQKKKTAVRSRRLRFDWTRRLRHAFAYLLLRPLTYLLPLDGRRALFSNYWGDKFSLSDGPAAICVELANTDPSFRCVVVANRHNMKDVKSLINEVVDNAKQVRVVRNKSTSFYWNFWRSKYLFNDVNFPVGFLTDKFVSKRSGQLEIQTTHGIPLKKMGMDSDQAIHPNELRKFLAKSSRYSYLVSSSPEVARIVSESHGVKPKLLRTGLPQNDFLFKSYSSEEIQNLKTKLGLDPEKRTIVYAPTFANGRGFAYRYLLDVEAMNRQLGDRHQLVIKPHPFNHTHLSFIDFRELTDWAVQGKESPFVRLLGEIRRDDSYVPAALTADEGHTFPEKELVAGDINELMLVADVLITDYSSIIFNYIHLQKPLILFTPHIENYSASRGMYFNIDEIGPGAIVKNTADLIAAIKDSESSSQWNELYGEKIERFKDRFLIWEKGNAAKKILDTLDIIDYSNDKEVRSATRE